MSLRAKGLSALFSAVIGISLLLPQFSMAATVDPALTPDEVERIAKEAFIYGYPLVLMEVTRRDTSNVKTPQSFKAPVNQFAHLREFPNADFSAVVRPNLDTLYSSAWLDLTVEPIVLSVPEMDRFYMMPLLSGWTDVFANPGTRTSGNKAQHFAIVGPFWKGELPKEVERINAPTNLVWIVGRTQTDGVQDYDNVRVMQNKYKLMPLSAFGKPGNYIPPEGKVNPAINSVDSPMDQVAKMDALTYFGLLSELLKKNPPHIEDWSLLKRISRIGITPAEPFVTNSLSPDTIHYLNKGIKDAYTQMNENYKSSQNFGEFQKNGWNIATKNIGTYGINYKDRAITALMGLGANRPEDAVYPDTTVDSKNQKLNASKKYILHFDSDKFPPARAFWSVTMYDMKGFLVKNLINRYSLSSRSQMKYNPDGSLDIYIQNTPPKEELMSNWLPTAQEGLFAVTMRLYWPEESVLDHTWTPPAIVQTGN